MSLRNYIDAIRFFINRTVDYDAVHFGGQHTLRACLFKLLNDYQIDTVIDVGANQGQFGLSIRSLGFRGKIYSFEPVQGAFDKLSEVASPDQDWHVFNYALGAESGEALINVSGFSSLSSLLDLNAYALNRWTSSEVTHKENIEIKTLDDCVAQGVFDAQRRLFLKMDTQGFDLEVFKGASSVIKNVSGMLSELSLIPFYEGMPGYAESLAIYEGHGFKVSGFYPITRNKDLSLNEVDCVLVNPLQFISL
ncbi:MAG: FkbM family methyltransferase [Halioglobus sp.]